MILDDEARYRVVESRDPRYDGCFFTGVMTTGIYCRPICPAPTPKRQNVRFFSCAAAAEEAGFRPCKRCRPETAPGTPAWTGTDATVSRALRLIADGFLDDHSVARLAEVLGMGPRHLDRLFAERVGSSPLRIARARRTHFAAKLLSESDLPVTEVAYGSGFGSVRQFNEAFRQTFRTTPSSLRRGAAAALEARAPSRRLRAATMRVDDGTAPGAVQARRVAGERSPARPLLTLSLAYRPPYPWEQVIEFYRRRAIPGVEVVEEELYRRSISWSGTEGILEVRRDPRGANALAVALGGIGPSHVKPVVDRVRRMFDLDADPQAIASHLSRDPRLSPLVAENPGARIPGIWSLFEAAVRAVVGQQVSLAAARSALTQIAERYGARLERPAGGVELLFPEAKAISAADLHFYHAPERRKRSLREVASFLERSADTLRESASLTEAVSLLSAVSGIGPWSAQYIALRGLGDPDAFPAEDLVLRKALGAIGVPQDRAGRREVTDSWHPWRGYAATYLWTSHLHTSGG